MRHGRMTRQVPDGTQQLPVIQLLFHPVDIIQGDIAFGITTAMAAVAMLLEDGPHCYRIAHLAKIAIA